MTLRPDLEDVLSARSLRRHGPLVDITLSAPGMEPVTGSALIDTGADRTAVDFGAVEDLTPKTFYAAQGVTSSSVTLPVYELTLQFPGTELPTVDVEHAAATPHLASQGLLALLGRDVLENAQLVYDGPSGAYALATPEGDFTVRAAPVAYGLLGAFALLGLVTAYAILKPCPPCAAAA